MGTISSNEYLVKDIGEATALLTMGIKVIRLEPEANFYWFVFGEKKECEKLSGEYWSGDLMVSAKTYSTNFRMLKDRLFAQK